MGPFPLNATYNLDTIGPAKLLPDGTGVTLTGKVVACVDGATTYIEDSCRPLSIRCEGVSGYSAGNVLASITGTLETDTAGRLILASSSVRQTGAICALRPFGAAIAYLPATLGACARTWGVVGGLSASGFTLTDGLSTLCVRYTGGGVANGNIAAVTGVYTINGDFLANSVTVF